VRSAPVAVSDETRDLLRFVDASPSPYHAAANVLERLLAAGFARVDPAEDWPDAVDRGVVVQGGAVIAWAAPEGATPATPFRLVGAHTDSPNLRVKAKPDIGRAGWRQIGVEVYGGALVNSWLDRDLGISGRVAVRDPGSAHGAVERLVKVDRPLLRVPQLAIHLDREINDKGLLLNKQQHLVPVWGLGARRPGELVELVAAEAGVAWHEVLGWDLMLHDLTPSTVGGATDELIFAPRLDNLLSCHAGLTAIERCAAEDAAPAAHVAVLCLFDHEEVGSTTSTGAAGSILARTLEQSVLARGGTRSDFLRALAGSLCASADMAHATHPNYADRHEPDHLITLDGGPVVKINANQRYASDAGSVAAFQLACDEAGVPTQRYIHRTDLACGSTIGPITAAGLAIPTVDVGVAQLSMHSAREMASSTEPGRFAAALTAFLAG
jgi:aspartyl aminopeptidase